MRYTLPVIWAYGGATRVGRLEVADGRLTLSSREHTYAFTAASVSNYVIERAPADRLRGLPALRVCLADGDELRIASMGPVGSLHALAGVIGGRQPVANGT